VNPSDNKFCGDCGTSLDPTVGAINAYLDANLAKRLDDAIKGRFRDQQITEIALAANVAEKVINWAKLLAIFIGVPLTITGTYLTYLGINYKDSLTKAKAEIDQSIESNRRGFDELNKRLQLSQAGANDIEKQESILKDALNKSSVLLQQVPTLVQKVNKLEAQFSWPLWCRGSVGMATTDGKDLIVVFSKGSRPANQGLEPSECFFLDRGLRPNEPNRIVDERPSESEAQHMAELINAGAGWTFWITNPGKGSFLAQKSEKQG